MKLSDTPLLKQSPILSTSPFLWEKSEPPVFKNFASNSMESYYLQQGK